MNRLTDAPLLDFETVEAEVVARDREFDNPYAKECLFSGRVAGRSLR